MDDMTIAASAAIDTINQVLSVVFILYPWRPVALVLRKIHPDDGAPCTFIVAGQDHWGCRTAISSFYVAIPSPTRLAAAMITRIPIHSSRSRRLSAPAHSPSARPSRPPKST